MKIPLGDKQVEATRVEFEVASDVWQVLRAGDGTEIRLKPVVTDLFRTDQVNPDGEPVYVVRAQVVVVTRTPEKDR